MSVVALLLVPVVAPVVLALEWVFSALGTPPPRKPASRAAHAPRDPRINAPGGQA